MQSPNIIESIDYYLLGYNYYGNPFVLSDEWTEENEIGRLWNRFNKDILNEDNIWIKNFLLKEELFEVHIYDEKTKETGMYDVFVGFEVKDFIKSAPINLLYKYLPKTKYAVFTLNGEDIETIFITILITNGFHRQTTIYQIITSSTYTIRTSRV